MEKSSRISTRKIGGVIAAAAMLAVVLATPILAKDKTASAAKEETQEAARNEMQTKIEASLDQIRASLDKGAEQSASSAASSWAVLMAGLPVAEHHQSPIVSHQSGPWHCCGGEDCPHKCPGAQVMDSDPPGKHCSYVCIHWNAAGDCDKVLKVCE